MSDLLEIAGRGAGPEGWIAGGGGPWWVLVPLAWIAVTATVVWLVSRRRSETPHMAVSDAAGILAARYARGEIDTDEYRSRLDELKGLR